MEFPKVQPTTEFVNQAKTSAMHLVSSKNRLDLMKVLAALMVENNALTTECNEHRAARGFDLLPTYAPPR